MSELQFTGDEKAEKLEEKGCISVNDPACGAGAMLIMMERYCSSRSPFSGPGITFARDSADRLRKSFHTDFLGSLYHYLDLQQEQKGQFFTPYHICECMSELQFTGDEKEEKLEENPRW